MVGGDSQLWMGGLHATQLQEVSNNPAVLDDGSFWAVSISFEGEGTFARFGSVTQSSFPAAPWNLLSGPWKSTMNENQYRDYVRDIREAIAGGDVYQVNACRELRHALDGEQSLAGLFSRILKGNPAPMACFLKVGDLEIASASPEKFLSRKGLEVITSPIKGTLPAGQSDFGEKDKSENLMIVDLMRNDFGTVCKPGSVEVTELFRLESHPTITHLVSDVSGQLLDGITWTEIYSRILPPGSVSGAPKSSALKIIDSFEGSRGPYCGILGWVHGDRAELAVAIRTFWRFADSDLRFGTGAGITWGSDPQSEWEETQLKARHLIEIAGGTL
jgi:para-aminobenzoate synthetase component 1